MSTETTTITKTIFLHASPDIVWTYLTESDKLAKWFHPLESDLAEGKDYRCIRINDQGEAVTQIWGHVLTMQAPETLKYTFIIEPFGNAETTVTWQLKAAAGGTQLSLLHEGIAEASGAAALQLLMALDKGWDEHFAQLRTAII